MRTHLKIGYALTSLILIVLAFVLTGCGGGSSGGNRDNTPKVLTPTPDGAVAFAGPSTNIDASHTDQGYVMVQYTGASDKPKLQIAMPNGNTYTYDINGEWNAFPLTGGDGTYTLTVLEHAYADQYTTAFTQPIDVALSNTYGPYLYPNIYVKFSPDSACVSKAAELANGCGNDIDVITKVYDYVINNITYDTAKAQSVDTGYVPNVDEVMASGTGICFDYTALMSAMLRSQGIPTRLEVGYAGTAYHAWLSVYTEETGWIDNAVEIKGSDWTLMDPTLAASNDNSAVAEFIGDGSSYQPRFVY
ncbi:MAG: transglutaminase domain-containing protein [Eubacteriaceae bacterium]|nr:transglutaminase domain-containing protein [Eubacteriaceae bacterium]